MIFLVLDMVVVEEWVVWVVTPCFGSVQQDVIYKTHSGVFLILWPSFPAYLSLLLLSSQSSSTRLWDGTNPSRASGKSSLNKYLLSTMSQAVL